VEYLRVRDAERGPAGAKVRVVSLPVSRLLGRGAMEVPAIGFDDEPDLRPVEIDAVRAEPLLCLRRGKPRPSDQAKNLALELRLRNAKGCPIDHRPERRSRFDRPSSPQF
jgi:hypothetical protein